jgi:hypothetical protein
VQKFYAAQNEAAGEVAGGENKVDEKTERIAILE